MPLNKKRENTEERKKETTTTTICFMVAFVRNDGKLCKYTVRRSDGRGSQCKTQWMIDTVSQIVI